MVALKKAPLIAAGTALALVAAGVVWWGLSRREGRSADLPVGAAAIPADALMVISLSTDEAQWQQLRQYGTPETQGRLDQFLARWRDRIFTAYDLSFQQDIQPWVGAEVTLAFLPPPPTETAPTLPEDTSYTVALLPVADGDAAQAVLGEAAGEAESQEYKGIDILTLDAEGGSLYGALLGADLVAVSPQAPLLEQTIDAYRSGKALGNSTDLVQAFAPLDAPRPFMRLYVDMPAAARSLAERSQPPLPGLANFSQARGLVGTVTLEARGIGLQAVSWLGSSPEVPFDVATSDGLLPQKLPQDALLMASTADFQNLWLTWRSGDRLGSLIPFDPQNMALGLEAATGLSLEEDLLPWMANEVALGILTPPAPPAAEAEEGEAAPLPNPALAILVETSDRSAAEATLATLDEVMADRYRFTVETADVQGVSLTRWVSPLEGLTFSYGWLPGDVVFLTLGEGLGETLVDPGRVLAEDSVFQLVTGAAPRPNSGHFFIDLAALTESQTSLLLPPLPEDGLVTTAAIESVGVTATVLGERQVRYDLFTALPQGREPGPLPEQAPEAEDAPPAPEE